MEILNRKAKYDYFIEEEFECGIELLGTEIKSIRQGKASLVDTFCYIENGEVWVKNMQISAYRLGYYYNHDVKRDRKLLLSKRQLKKYERETKETGNTIIPIRLYVNEKGLAKLEIALAKGKKAYDKRETLKAKEAKTDMDRYIKNY